MINAIFTIKIQHDEDTLIALSHMRYDLFSTGNRIARDLLSALLIVVAVLYGNASLWSFLLIIMACFLFTGTYASSDRTARRIADQIRTSGLSFPCSIYQFESAGMRIIAMPEQEETDFLLYNSALRLGEDPRSLLSLFQSLRRIHDPQKRTGKP